MDLIIVVIMIFALLTALLAVPIDLAFNINRDTQTHHKVSGRVDVRWLFGLIRFSVNIPENHHSNKIKQPQKTTTKKQSKISNTNTRPSKYINLFKQGPFRQRVFKFARDLLVASHYQGLFLRLRIGVGDPADTGQLWILFGPLAAMARNLRNATVRIEPEFLDPAFEFQSRGKFRFFPIEFIALTIAFALSPPSLRAWRSLVSM